MPNPQVLTLHESSDNQLDIFHTILHAFPLFGESDCLCTIDAVIPKALVWKDTWMFHDNAQLIVVKGVSGYFGSPKLWAYQRMGDNIRFINEARYWKLFKLLDSVSHATSNVGEHRSRIRLYFETVGTHLDETLCSYDLIVTIMHATIGHYTMLIKTGFLHGDPSLDNFLQTNMTDFTWFDEAKRLFEVLGLPLPTTCCGIIIDADLAKEHNKAARANRTVSGTLPYLSDEILSALRAEAPVSRSVLDDLEGIVWVLAVCGLYQAGRIQPTSYEEKLRGGMESDQIGDITAARVDLQRYGKQHALFGLILQWKKLLEDAARDFVHPLAPDEMLEHYSKIYIPFLRLGYDWLNTHPDLKKDWRSFVVEHSLTPTRTI